MNRKAMGQTGTGLESGSIGRYRAQQRVRWSDIDASGIILWSAYTRLVEVAETELFRAAGFPYATLWDRLDVWLPRVQFHLDYRSPARLDDLLDIEIWIGRIGRSSIRFELAMKKADGQLAAEGYLVIVAVSRTDGKSVAVPETPKALEPYGRRQILTLVVQKWSRTAFRRRCGPVKLSTRAARHSRVRRRLMITSRWLQLRRLKATSTAKRCVRGARCGRWLALSQVGQVLVAPAWLGAGQISRDNGGFICAPACPRTAITGCSVGWAPCLGRRRAWRVARPFADGSATMDVRPYCPGCGLPVQTGADATPCAGRFRARGSSRRSSRFPRIRGSDRNAALQVACAQFQLDHRYSGSQRAFLEPLEQSPTPPAMQGIDCKRNECRGFFANPMIAKPTMYKPSRATSTSTSGSWIDLGTRVAVRASPVRSRSSRDIRAMPAHRTRGQLESKTAAELVTTGHR
jgi:acyl-CoA thioester hydrolase